MAPLVAALCAATLLAAAGVACGDDERTLRILAHGSFDATAEVIAAFEEEHGVEVEVLLGGDANEVLSRAILNAGNPEADLLFGVDNLSAARARAAGVFQPYTPTGWEDIPANLRAALGDGGELTPIDYGYVALNAAATLDEEPEALRDLASPRWAERLVVQDPTTSSPGLQFLATTVAAFGESGAYDWRDFWADLRRNGVLVTDGWTEAYYTHFTQYGGDRPLVVSYTTSPAAEVFFGELAEPPTRNVIPGGMLVRQVEGAGILAGAEEPGLAGLFIDYMLTDAFQSQIPETMFVYPVRPGIETPPWWRWAVVEVAPRDLQPDAETVERWLTEWTEIMRR